MGLHHDHWPTKLKSPSYVLPSRSRSDFGWPYAYAWNLHFKIVKSITNPNNNLENDDIILKLLNLSQRYVNY